MKGRVFLYDDATKTLILKLWSDDLHQYTGVAVYNAANVQLECIHALQDLEEELGLGDHQEDDEKAGGQRLREEAEQEMMTREFSCGEDSYSKIVVDRKERFCKEQIEKRKQMLDEKYGARKQGIGAASMLA